MGRLTKRGLDYFNIDCDQEDKITLVEAKHGIEGYGIVVKLWKKIYQIHGYYCEWSEKNVFLFSKEINVSVDTLNRVVETCLEEQVFSRHMFDKYKVLTSSGIQKRWKKIVTDAKRKEVEIDLKMNLLSFTLEEISKTPEETEKTLSESTQNKVNKNREEYIEPKGSFGDVSPKEEQKGLKNEYSRIQKTKGFIVDFIRSKKPLFIEPYFDLWNLFAQETKLPEMKELNDTRRKKFNVRIREKSFNFLEILRKAKSSEMLLTSNWFGFDWVIKNETGYLKVLEGNYDNKKPETLRHNDKSDVQQQILERQKYSERARQILDSD
jgi:hypothetical protein